MQSPFDQLMDTIKVLDSRQALTDHSLLKVLALAERNEDLREGVQQLRQIGRRLWGMPLVEAVYEYRAACEEADALAHCKQGPELERRLLCTLYTRGAIVRLVEQAWDCRSKPTGEGVRLLRRAVRLADGLLPFCVVEDLEYEGTPAYQYLEALRAPTPWRHPREDPERTPGHLDNVESLRARTRPQATQAEFLTEGDFLTGRIVDETEHKIHDQVRTRAYLANALRINRRLPEAHGIWQQVDALLEPDLWIQAPPDALMGEVYSLRAAYLQDTGRLRQAEQCALVARDLLQRAGDEEGVAIQQVQRMAILYDDGRADEVLRHQGKLEELPGWLRAFWRHTVAAACADLGLRQEARQHYEQLDPPEAPRAEAAHQLLLAHILHLEGEVAAAREAYQEARRKYAVVGRPGEVLLALVGEGLVLCEQGLVEEASSLLASGLPLASSVPDAAVQAAFNAAFCAAQQDALTRQVLQACVEVTRRARKRV